MEPFEDFHCQICTQCGEVYASYLKRAVKTAWLMLDELELEWVPMGTTWRLNERHYGALQGLSKKAVADVMGLAETKELRKGYDAKPPALPAAHTLSPLRERKYAEVDVEELPLSESLRECLERVTPLWREKIFAFLSRNAMDATTFYKLPADRVVELGIQVPI